MMRYRAIVALVTAGMCLTPPVIRAWGPEGHHIVARIALARLTPEAKQGVETLLGPEDFVAVSTWADEIRSQRPETYNWHFVDIPFGEQKYDAARDCKTTPQGDCVIAQLERARKDLTDASLPADRRREALKWLIHLMGDLHMPLHAIDNHDRGGNDVLVTIVGQPPPDPGVRVNLHGVWDTRLIAIRNPDEVAYVESLATAFKGQQLYGTPIDFATWAEQSHQIAVEYAYTYPGFTPGAPPTSPIGLSKDYQQAATLAIDHQLELAGVRLGALLNTAFRAR